MYRWRGEQSRDNRIQLGSDEKIHTLHFNSPSLLHGRLYTDVQSRGSVDFAAVKVSDETDLAYEPATLWKFKNAAYDEGNRRARFDSGLIWVHGM